MSRKRTEGVLALLAAAALFGAGCATPRPAGSVVEVEGILNLLQMGQQQCWILETGTMREKTFYELMGPERLLKRLQRNDAQARLRLRLLPEQRGTCGVGIAAEVVEILFVKP